MKSARRIFGQALPAPTFFVKVAQHFNAGQVGTSNCRTDEIWAHQKVRSQLGIDFRTHFPKPSQLSLTFVNVVVRFVPAVAGFAAAEIEGFLPKLAKVLFRPRKAFVGDRFCEHP